MRSSSPYVLLPKTSGDSTMPCTPRSLYRRDPERTGRPDVNHRDGRDVDGPGLPLENPRTIPAIDRIGLSGTEEAYLSLRLARLGISNPSARFRSLRYNDRTVRE